MPVEGSQATEEFFNVKISRKRVKVSIVLIANQYLYQNVYRSNVQPMFPFLKSLCMIIYFYISGLALAIYWPQPEYNNFHRVAFLMKHPILEFHNYSNRCTSDFVKVLGSVIAIVAGWPREESMRAWSSPQVTYTSYERVVMKKVGKWPFPPKCRLEGSEENDKKVGKREK